MASFLLKTFDQCVIMSRKQVTGKILRKFVYLLKKMMKNTYFYFGEILTCDTCY